MANARTHIYIDIYVLCTTHLILAEKWGKIVEKGAL